MALPVIGPHRGIPSSQAPHNNNGTTLLDRSQVPRTSARGADGQQAESLVSSRVAGSSHHSEAVAVHTRVLLLLAVLSVAGTGWADTYRVRNTNDSGTYSLRWAIEQANSHVGRDRIVFAPHMSGKVIRAAGQLPLIYGNRTIINGDIDGDGAPDVAVRRTGLGTGYAISIQANYCTIAGLAITDFSGVGIHIKNAHHNTIRSCHIGVNLLGTKAVPNTDGGILIESSDYNTIGGASPGEGNVISAAVGDNGIHLLDSSYNVIAGNHIGVKRSGMEVLGNENTGIRLRRNVGACQENRIGGTTPVERNVFGGLRTGVNIDGATQNTIVGNYFGLAADGSTLLSIATECVLIGGGATGNVVGGTAPGERNVCAGDADYGVMLTEPNTTGNRVQGNYLGTNAAGDRQRRLDCGVYIGGGAKAQVIGGNLAAAGNYFTIKGYCYKAGVFLQSAGSGSLIRHNTFGILPNGEQAPLGMESGVRCEGCRPNIEDNLFARCGFGIGVMHAGANPRVSRNIFRNCSQGVYIDSDARCRLGDLGNSSSKDDGGNIFRPSNTWHIWNNTSYRVPAEGNRFGTTLRSEINAKLYDRRDDATKGKVDFIPLFGGVIPTGDSFPLTVTSATALPTKAGGAEVAFSLSASADVTVTVLNIAGRPVATVCRDLEAAEGPQRVIWSGRTDGGLRVPNGTYLARIAARSDDGRQAQAICRLRLAR
jgi:hypothetical protein